MNLVGKSPEQIDLELASVRKRDRLIRIIKELAVLESFFSPEQVADKRGITVASVMARIKDGRLRAHLVSHNRWRIPLSAVHEWDEKTLV